MFFKPFLHVCIVMHRHCQWTSVLRSHGQTQWTIHLHQWTYTGIKPVYCMAKLGPGHWSVLLSVMDWTATGKLGSSLYSLVTCFFSWEQSLTVVDTLCERSRLCGSNAVPALATLFLMSYTKTLQTVTNALAMSWIVCDNGSVFLVWSVDGNIPYLSGKHVLLLVFSCSVLLLGVVYPVLVLFAPLLEKYGDKCFPVQWNPVANLKPLLDAYGGPYKDKYRF